MDRHEIRLWILVPLFWFLAVPPVRTTESSVLAFTHATLIDGTGGPAQRDVTVVVNGERISTISHIASTNLPPDAVVIDATGKFLIPGLWDMHVHWYDKEYLPLFLVNGVTGVRVMHGTPMHHEWKKEIEVGKLLGPRLYIGSPILDGPKPAWPGSTAVATPIEGREAVSKARHDGAEFLKVYSLLPRDAYFAIAEEAKRQNLTFAGHIPIGVSVEEASAAGQRSVEHLTGMLSACSTQEVRLLQNEQAIFSGLLATNDPVDALNEVQLQSKLALQTYSQTKVELVCSILRSNQTWQCPTLVALRNISHLDESSTTNDLRVRYIPRAITASWKVDVDPRSSKEEIAEDWALHKKVFRKEMEIIGSMHRARVGFLAGTDTRNPYCFPGFSLHDELALLVQAGLTATEALQAATRNPARFMGREQDLGTIEPGKLADMVLLDANPLETIGNTRKIQAVVYGGRLFPRAALDEMLSNAEALSAKSIIPLSMALASIIDERGIDAAIQQYHELKRTQPMIYDFSEPALNSLGYDLLVNKKLKEAIQIFRLNVEAYPGSANVYDSLGEAYRQISDSTVDNIRKRNGIGPAPERVKQTTWRQFLKAHWDGLVAADFFTTEVMSWRGLVTYYTLFVIQLRSRLVLVCGTTVSPDSEWMKHVARQLTDAMDGFARGKTHLIIDRDTKYCSEFRQILESSGIQIVLCPPRVPQCNAIAERFVRSIKTECVERFIFLGEGHLRRTFKAYETHYNSHRNHQGMENQLLMTRVLPVVGRICCQKQVGGLLNYYYRQAA
jgi:transposase InsO family protein